MTLGIDIAASSFRAALRLKDGQTAEAGFSNNYPGFQNLCSWLRQQGARRGVAVGIECSNVYGADLAEHLHGRGYAVYLLNPEICAKYGRVIGQRNKTDEADARTIAQYVALHLAKLTRWTPPPPAQLKLRHLTRARHSLIGLREQLANTLRTAAAPRPLCCAQRSSSSRRRSGRPNGPSPSTSRPNRNSRSRCAACARSKALA